MTEENGLRYGSLGQNVVHLCVDMQRLFAEETNRRTPWMERVLPNVLRIVEVHSARTIFTRFIPIYRPGQGEETWKRYYERWQSMTVETLGREMTDLVPELQQFAPPGRIADRRFIRLGSSRTGRDATFKKDRHACSHGTRLTSVSWQPCSVP